MGRSPSESTSGLCGSSPAVRCSPSFCSSLGKTCQDGMGIPYCAQAPAVLMQACGRGRLPWSVRRGGAGRGGQGDEMNTSYE